MNKRVIAVTFDGSSYRATSPELREPITALSLSILRKRIEAVLMAGTSGDGPIVVLSLDRAAREERDLRRQQAHLAR
jgi:hypothetical protein